MADESSEVHTPLIALSPEPSVDIRSGRVWGPRGKLEKSEPWVVCVRSEPLYPKTRWTRRSLPRSGHGRHGRRGTVEPTSNIGAASCGSSEAGSTDLHGINGCRRIRSCYKTSAKPWALRHTGLRQVGRQCRKLWPDLPAIRSIASTHGAGDISTHDGGNAKRSDGRGPARIGKRCTRPRGPSLQGGAQHSNTLMKAVASILGS